MNRLVIIGASGHGKVVADIALRNGYKDIVFLDDNENVKECFGFPVIGCTSGAAEITGDKIVAIGNAKIRERIQRKIETITLVHPDAIIGEKVEIGKGSVVMAGTVINPETIIGEGCIVNTSASIDHDCLLQDYVHVAVGAHLCGTVHIGKGTWVGAGATIINNISVCDECMIGAGGLVIRDIEIPGTYVGVPVKRIEKR